MRRYTSRVVINRAQVEAIRLAVEDGMFEVGRVIIDGADVPDATPLGLGLIQGGGVIAYVDGRKVNGTTIGGKQIKKPRAVKLGGTGILVIGGFGFPGRLVHNGSIHNVANPFLARSMFATAPTAGNILRRVVRPRLAAIS
jgi:hypothetical protein